MNKISNITRRDIFDTLTVEGVNWNGRLEETDFLSRLYNLSKSLLLTADLRMPMEIFGSIV